MQYRYSDNIKELNESAQIPIGDIYDYEHSPIKELYEKYFQFCQVNLTEECHEYAIQPARFYYRTQYGINARAGKSNGYFIIGVNMETIYSLYSLFYDRNDIFETNEYLLGNYGDLAGKLDVPIGHLLFQIATLFTFYHERAHLIQQAPSNLTIWFSEQHDDSTEPEFSIERHILELDADLDAAHRICFHLIEYWKKLEPEDRTQANLQNILSIGVASIFSYFLLYFKEESNVYYKKYRHPHPLIRITYIVDCFIRVAEINLPADIKLDLRATLREGFTISDIFFTEVLRSPLVKAFVDRFKAEGENIDNYVNELLATSESMPNLVKNRFK